jgi:hypothetical protein
MNYFTGDWFQDNLIMTDILDQIDFYSGSERKRMLRVPFKIGGSMLYGTTWKSYLSPTKKRTKDEETGLYKTKIYDLYPELKNIFKEFADYHLPTFNYTQVQMNKNFPCPPHIDSQNIGESILCCFGDYPEKEGKTCIWINNQITRHDAREAPIRFNGSKLLHWVEPFYRGTRYALVFFKNYK